MSERQPIEPGAVFEHDYPFICEEQNEMDWCDESNSLIAGKTVEYWHPGMRADSGGEDILYEADGVGKRILTVVSLHRPGKFPERVFYTRMWRDPTGKVFDNKKLHVMAVSGFRNLTKGYRYAIELSADAERLASKRHEEAQVNGERQ